MVSVPLVVRPEEISRSHPMRVTVHQSIAPSIPDPVGWADDFGPGLPMISVTGNTGWKISGGEDGGPALKALYDFLYVDYPAARQAAIDAGRDANLVRLILVDEYHGRAERIKTISFKPHRSKSNPLLYIYSGQFQVIGPAVERRAPEPEEDAAPLNDFVLAIADLEMVAPDVAPVVDAVARQDGGARNGVGSAAAEFSGVIREVLGRYSAQVRLTGLASLSPEAAEVGAVIADGAATTFQAMAATPGLDAGSVSTLREISAPHAEIRDALRAATAARIGATLTTETVALGLNEQAIGAARALASIDVTSARPPLHELARLMGVFVAGRTQR